MTGINKLNLTYNYTGTGNRKAIRYHKSTKGQQKERWCVGMTKPKGED